VGENLLPSLRDSRLSCDSTQSLRAGLFICRSFGAEPRRSSVL